MAPQYPIPDTQYPVLREARLKPGEYLLEEGVIAANAGRETARVRVRNTGDRPVQVGSHYHFFEVNRALEFDRAAAYGMRLNVASGTAVRFEPGEEKDVLLVAFRGDRTVFGHNGLVSGPLDGPGAGEAARKRVEEGRYLNRREPEGGKG